MEPVKKQILSLKEPIRKHVQAWLEGPYDQETKQKIISLLANDPKAIEDAFFQSLSFGTAGIRGMMGVGSNRINRYTIGRAAQALANYLKKFTPLHQRHRVIIGYDSRHYSSFFAHHCAQVLAGNNHEVYLCKELRPTPLISFGCRDLQCKAAIMITASHNPSSYNGFKVYWEDGGQVLPPHDKGIIEEYQKLKSPLQIALSDPKDPLIHKVDESLDDRYIETLHSTQNLPEQNCHFGKELTIVYSNLHGTGITLVPRLLKDWGFSSFTLVDKQKDLDGDFPGAPYPNPELKEALAPGISELKEKKGDILIATDPDADRVGVAVWHQGKPVILNGNEIACLCLHHLILSKKSSLKKRGATVKSIVTTELFKKIAETSSWACFDVLIGFKYVAEKMRNWEKEDSSYQFIFGAEESHGFLFHPYTRDKDGVAACGLISEIALQAKREKKTLVDLLFSLYQEYGVYREGLRSLPFEESEKGMESMKKFMEKIRKVPPTRIADIPVHLIEDYLKREKIDLISGKKEGLELPSSNILRYFLQDGSKIVIRPSGTEPKIKIYAGARETSFTDLEKTIKTCDERVEKLLSSFSPS